MNIPPEVYKKISLLTQFYRQSQSRWAGGEHSLRFIEHDRPWIEIGGGSDKVWSKNGKWSGTVSSFFIRCNQEFIDKLVENDSEHFIGFFEDQPVFVPHKENKPISRVFFVKQATGFNIKRIEGWAFLSNEPGNLKGFDIKRRLVISCDEKKAYKMAGRTIPKDWLPSPHLMWHAEERMQKEILLLTDRDELVKYLITAWQTDRWRHTHKETVSFIAETLIRTKKISKKEVKFVLKNLEATANLV